MSKQVITSEAVWTKGLAVQVSAGDQRWELDGANGLGPTPVQALVGALAGCLGVLSAAFAPAHDVVIDAVRVRVDGDFDPDGYQGKADVRTGFSGIRYQLEIDSKSPRERVDALIAHAVQVCPIKDTLLGVPVSGTETARAA